MPDDLPDFGEESELPDFGESIVDIAKKPIPEIPWQVKSPEQFMADFGIDPEQSPESPSQIKPLSLGKRIRMSPIVEKLIGPPEIEAQQMAEPPQSPKSVGEAALMFLPLGIGPETLAGKALLGTFGYQYLKQQPEAIQQIAESYKTRNAPELGRQLTQEALGALMLGTAGREAFGRKSIQPPKRFITPQPTEELIPERIEPDPIQEKTTIPETPSSSGQKIAEDIGARFDGQIRDHWNFTMYDNAGKESTTFSVKAGSSPEEIRSKYEVMRKAYEGESNQPRPVKLSPSQQIKQDQIKTRIKDGIEPQNIQITVNKTPEIPEASFVQVDEIHPEKGNTFSSNPEQMNSLGFKMPSSEKILKLPSGKYKLSDVQKLKTETKEPVKEVVSEKPPEGQLLTPAIQVGKKTYFGNTHSEAVGKARAAGEKIPDDNESMRGFVNTEGQFIDRKQAAADFEDYTGNKITRPEGLHSEDLIEVGLLKPGEKTIQQTKSPTVEPAELVGMGGALAGQVTTKPELSQLTDALRTMAQGQPKPRLKQAYSIGEKISKAKDVVNKGLDGLNAVRQYSLDKLQGLPTWNGLKQAVGNWKLSLFENGQVNRDFIDKAFRGIPNQLDRDAISKWLGAGGNDSKLVDMMVNTKPQFKSMYMRARNLPPELRTVAENIKNYFDSRLQQAVDSGFLEEGIEDYIHRIYEKDSPWKQGVIAQLRSGVFTGKPAFAKQRVFQYDYEAEQAGYPIVHDFAKRVAAYDFALNKAIADRQLVKDFMSWKMPDGRPAIDAAGIGTPVQSKEGGALLIKPQFKRTDLNNPKNNRNDYIAYDHPALRKWKWLDTDQSGKTTMVQGNVLVHPDAYKQVNAVFGRSKIRQSPIGRTALGVSSAIKQTMLDISGFHPVQITVHGWEHRTFKPVDKINLEDPVQSSLISHGLEPGDPRGNQAFSEGLSGSSLTRYIPGIGPKLQAYNEWLFQSYIPRLKMGMAIHALERNRTRFQKQLTSGKMSEDQLLHLTANQANAAFGELNYEMMARNKTVQDALRLGLLAPDFLEARGRFAAQAGTQFGKEQRTALLFGAATLYITARIINKLLDDQYHFEPQNMFNVVYNKKAYSLRTVQGDLLHAAMEPAKFVMNRLNPTYGRTTMEFLTGRDYFGRKRTGLEQIRDFANTIVPISFRGLLNPREQNMVESFWNAFGITERRYVAADTIFKLADDYKKKHGIVEPGELIYDREKDPYRGIKLALAYSTPKDAAEEIAIAVRDGKLTRLQIQKYFQRYGSTPFTGSKLRDRDFYNSLTEDQKKTFQEAIKERQKIKRNAMIAQNIFYKDFVAKKPQITQ